MKRSSKTILSTLLCGAMIGSAASCAFGQTYPITVDGEQIRAGIYILEQSNAIDNAKEKIGEEQPDLDTTAEGFSYFDQTVEGKKFEDWVNEKTIEYCCNYIAIDRLFEEYGLTLDSDHKKEVDSYVKTLWTEENQYAQYIYGVSIVGEYYEKIGVGEQSFKDLQYMSEKSEKIFDYLYGENGIKAATAEEINAKLASDYIAVNYFEVDPESGEDAQKYVDRIKNGDSFELAYRDYTQVYNLEQKAKEVAESIAKESANGEETASDTDAQTDDSEAASEPEEVAVPETDSLIKIINKDSGSPFTEFVKQAFEMSIGEVKVITVADGDDTRTYVVQKLDILEKPDATTETVSAVRSELKKDEYQELIDSTGKTYKVTDDGSKGMYKLQTIMDSKTGIYA